MAGGRVLAGRANLMAIEAVAAVRWGAVTVGRAPQRAERFYAGDLPRSPRNAWATDGWRTHRNTYACATDFRTEPIVVHVSDGRAHVVAPCDLAVGASRHVAARIALFSAFGLEDAVTTAGLGFAGSVGALVARAVIVGGTAFTSRAVPTAPGPAGARLACGALTVLGAVARGAHSAGRTRTRLALATNTIGSSRVTGQKAAIERGDALYARAGGAGPVATAGHPAVFAVVGGTASAGAADRRLAGVVAVAVGGGPALHAGAPVDAVGCAPGADALLIALAVTLAGAGAGARGIAILRTRDADVALARHPIAEAGFTWAHG